MERRRLYALLLSVIILPTFFLTSFHHHEIYPDTDCVDCGHQHPHGHLGQRQGTGDCLICQFLSITWLPSFEERLVKPQEKVVRLSEEPAGQSVILPDYVLSTRAPPTVFC